MFNCASALFFLRTFTLILKAGKTMSTVTNTSLYIIGSDSLVQLILMINLYAISRKRKSTDLYVRKIPGLGEKMKKESSTVSTYSYEVHELITEAERNHRGLEMQYPRLKNVYRSLQVVWPTIRRNPLSKFVIWFMTG